MNKETKAIEKMASEAHADAVVLQAQVQPELKAVEAAISAYLKKLFSEGEAISPHAITAVLAETAIGLPFALIRLMPVHESQARAALNIAAVGKSAAAHVELHGDLKEFSFWEVSASHLRQDNANMRRNREGRNVRRLDKWHRKNKAKRTRKGGRR